MPFYVSEYFLLIGSYWLQRKISCAEEDEVKRKKPNVCIACFGIFQNDMIDVIVNDVLQKSDLNSYECDTLYTSIAAPIIVQIRDLAIWIALLENFPASISDSKYFVVRKIEEN